MMSAQFLKTHSYQNIAIEFVVFWWSVYTQNRWSALSNNAIDVNENAALDRAASSCDTAVTSIGRPHDVTDSCKKTRLVVAFGIHDSPASAAVTTNFAKA